MTVFIYNIPLSFSYEEMLSVLLCIGKVERISFSSGQKFGFVDFSSEVCEFDAISRLKGYPIANGKHLGADKARVSLQDSTKLKFKVISSPNSPPSLIYLPKDQQSFREPPPSSSISSSFSSYRTYPDVPRPVVYSPSDIIVQLQYLSPESRIFVAKRLHAMIQEDYHRGDQFHPPGQSWGSFSQRHCIYPSQTMSYQPTMMPPRQISIEHEAPPSLPSREHSDDASTSTVTPSIEIYGTQSCQTVDYASGLLHLQPPSLSRSSSLGSFDSKEVDDSTSITPAVVSDVPRIGHFFL
ncbi:hypothetical protein ADUPG1_013281 [Aduncisulcus paluster]|uniref:RRM domain-containing protein n=1 Tax=Aduncisulcus paluster TaxID=2918883 RepID=A0ABQ5K2D2_9EUKA|nr:hypothetical protein ADUPG1_013281 [Aduncisulcus paluster]